MNATAEHTREQSYTLAETGVHQPEDSADSRANQPAGLFDMPDVNPKYQPQGRYTFGSGARPLDGYTIKRAIGRGGFGEVYYATSDAGKEVALKLILRNLDVERRGVMQCMNLKCPNLLAIHDIKISDDGDTFVVMEYVAGPSLANVLKQHPDGLPQPELRLWLRQLVEGVAYLHDHGIVHRDLKPANLFMEEGIVKIGDYGLAKLITPSHGSEHSESIGTCHYMAPEIGSGKYHKPIDIYAMGIIMYEMITGRVPFEGETVNEVLMKHLTSRPDVSMIAEPYQSIVARALAKDPNHRPQRVYDLLPPGEAPREPEVRIIGDRNPGRTIPIMGDPKEEDGILRIEAEEPVFYIGPDTRPTRAGRLSGYADAARRMRVRWEGLLGQACNRYDRTGARAAARPNSPLRSAAEPVTPREAFANAFDAAQAAAVASARAAKAGTKAAMMAAEAAQPAAKATARAARATGRVIASTASRIAAASQRPAAVPQPPVVPRAPEPPPVPSLRVRFAELSSSMLLAAPLVALLTIPAAAVMNFDPYAQPQQLANLFGLSLLGTWAVLVPAKITELRPVDKFNRRLISLAAGLLVGCCGMLIGQMLKLNAQTAPVNELSIENTQLLFFGLLFPMTNGWHSLTTRDRIRRFRVGPIFWTALVAGCLTPLWPTQNVEGFLIATMIATAVQMVSPWSEASSLYAQYVRAASKKKGFFRRA
jgi:hypothetical protein